jgi:hypothetical protein
LQEGLRARTRQQIVASHDLIHPLVGIVNNNRQVIGGMTITAGDREVPKISEWGELVSPCQRIKNFDLNFLHRVTEGWVTPCP